MVSMAIETTYITRLQRCYTLHLQPVHHYTVQILQNVLQQTQKSRLKSKTFNPSTWSHGHFSCHLILFLGTTLPWSWASSTTASTLNHGDDIIGITLPPSWKLARRNSKARPSLPSTIVKPAVLCPVSSQLLWLLLLFRVCKLWE